MDLFTELPLLVWAKIIHNLSVKEKCRLRLVCKALKELVDLHGPTDLVLHEAGSPPGTKWLLTNEEMRERTMVCVSSTKPADVGFDRYFLGRLRRLCIYHANQADHLLVGVNCLDQLEVLHVVGIDGFDSKEGPELSIELPNLKVISVEQTYVQFYLSTPKLKSVFEFENAPAIRFKYPETVRFLKRFGTFENYLFANDRPKQLEEIICRRLNRSFDLDDYPNLKKLSVYPDQETLPVVERIIGQKNASNRHDLEILVSGYREIRPTFISFPFGPHHFQNQPDQTRQFANNYADWVGGMPFRFGFCYDTLIRHFGGSLPADFTEKVDEIGLLAVWGRDQGVSETDLLNFLRKNYVRELVLKEKVAFSQAFHDLLPMIRGIKQLVLRYSGPENFDFILNFKSLDALELIETGKLPIRTVHSAFKNLKSLFWFQFVKDRNGNLSSGLILRNVSNQSSTNRPRSAGLSWHYPYELSFTFWTSRDESGYKLDLNLEEAISEIKNLRLLKDLIVDL